MSDNNTGLSDLSQSLESLQSEWDAIVLGGGFYGVNTACFLKSRFQSVLLVEQTGDLLTQASYVNQARIHNGYHYPRHLLTAIRSRVNFPRFISDYQDAVVSDFTKLYAIPRQLTKVNANQFQSLFKRLEARIEVASPNLKALFASQNIEQVFQVKEYAFDANQLRKHCVRMLGEMDIPVVLNTTGNAIRFEEQASKPLTLDLSQNGFTRRLNAKVVFNTTYSKLNQILAMSQLEPLPLKYEWTELCLIEPPPELKHLGITVMDGPFFSCMPFPAEQLHSFSHVRYTPHYQWVEGAGLHTEGPPETATNYPMMRRDAERYLPVMRESTYIKSLFTTKTVLQLNETNDGRPILLHQHQEYPGLFSIMGGKIDNIYDILERLKELFK